MDNHTGTVDNLGTSVRNTPNRQNTRNVSYPSPNLRPVTRPGTETHLLRSSEVMDLLHIGKTTLWDWRENGRLEAIRHHPKGRWYFPANQPIISNAMRAVGSLR